MTEPIHTTHGYDDAVAGRTALVKASAVWARGTKEDLTLAAQKREMGHVTRSALMRGIELTTGSSWTMDALVRKIHAEDRRVVREAPLVYVSPGVTRNLEAYTATVPDIHVLPFAGPMLLWFADPIDGDDFEPFSDTDLVVPIPIRAMIARPYVEHDGTEVIYYQTLMHVDDVSAINARRHNPETGELESVLDPETAAEYARETRERLVPQIGEYHTETVGRVTCGVTDTERIGRSATVVARTLNAMSAREVRMLEDETDERRVRKDAKRAGVTDPGAINVIYLPRERKPGSRYVPADEHADGTVRRRHGVRAHWRRQPYGPRGAGQWRWTRIEAHERGAGAKLADRPTVYAAQPRKEHDK